MDTKVRLGWTFAELGRAPAAAFSTPDQAPDGRRVAAFPDRSALFQSSSRRDNCGLDDGARLLCVPRALHPRGRWRRRRVRVRRRQADATVAVALLSMTIAFRARIGSAGADVAAFDSSAPLSMKFVHPLGREVRNENGLQLADAGRLRRWFWLGGAAARRVATCRSAESPPDEVEVRVSAGHRVHNTVKRRVRGVVWASFWTVCPRR